MKFFELTLFVSKKENPSGFGISELNPKRDALMDYFDFGEKITDKNLKISAIIECENNKVIPDIMFYVDMNMPLISEKFKELIEPQLNTQEVAVYPIEAVYEDGSELPGKWHLMQFIKWIECVEADRNCNDASQGKLIGYDGMDGPPLKLSCIPEDVDLFLAKLIDKPIPNQLYQHVIFSERIKKRLKEQGIMGLDFVKSKNS
jgi:hypothetical protein